MDPKISITPVESTRIEQLEQAGAKGVTQGSLTINGKTYEVTVGGTGKGIEDLSEAQFNQLLEILKKRPEQEFHTAVCRDGKIDYYQSQQDVVDNKPMKSHEVTPLSRPLTDPTAKKIDDISITLTPVKKEMDPKIVEKYKEKINQIKEDIKNNKDDEICTLLRGIHVDLDTDSDFMEGGDELSRLREELIEEYQEYFDQKTINEAKMRNFDKLTEVLNEDTINETQFDYRNKCVEILNQLKPKES